MSTYYVAGIPYTSELYHHGIKGQKWGVRRFENPDGTLTAAGKARYGTVENFQRAKKAHEKPKRTPEEYRSRAHDQAVDGLIALVGGHLVSGLAVGTMLNGHAAVGNILGLASTGLKIGGAVSIGKSVYNYHNYRKKNSVYKSEAEKALERERNRFKRPTVSEAMKKNDRYNI